MRKKAQLWTRRLGTTTLYENFSIKGLPRFRRSLETDDPETAQFVAGQRKATEEKRVRQGLSDPSAPREITLSQALEQHREYMFEEKKTSAKIAVRYALDLIEILGGDRPFHTITTAEMSEFIRKMRLREGKWRGKIARRRNATIRNRIIHLKAATNRARDIWKVRVPDINWKALLLKKDPRPTRTIQGQEELDLIMRTLAEDTRDIFVFFYLTGCRRSNALNLRWRDIDWSKGEINVIQKGNHNLVIGITPLLEAVLRQQEGNHPDRVFTYVCKLNSREFDEKTGQRVVRSEGQRYPFTLQTWRMRWDAVRKAIPNGEDLNPHRIRASAITLMLDICGNAELVRMKVGHADIKTTLSYVSVLPKNVRDAAERAERTDPGLRSLAELYRPTRSKRLRIVDRYEQ